MVPITYGTLEEVYTVNGVSRTAYGIAAYADADADGTATVVASVRDITPYREKADGLAELCNRLELSVLHLYDVVEDLLDE